MPAAKQQTKVACRYLDERQQDALVQPHAFPLGEGRTACFLTLNLTTGELSLNSTNEFVDGPPWLVAVCWSLRWPVAPLLADRANKLLDEITPHAQTLVDTTSTELPDQERPGTVLYYGAGPALDAVQRLCAATWTDPDRLHREQQ